MWKILVMAAVLGTLPASAFARPPSFGDGGFFGRGDHGGHGDHGGGGGGENGGGPHKGAPAPLLAAGIPAFIALGGAAGIARLVRRRRDKAQGLAEMAHGTSPEV